MLETFATRICFFKTLALRDFLFIIQPPFLLDSCIVTSIDGLLYDGGIS